MKLRHITLASSLILFLIGCSVSDTNVSRPAGLENAEGLSREARFNALNNLPWVTKFENKPQQYWQDQWFLDGARANVLLENDVILFKAGPRAGDDADHAVLWTRDIFSGDIKISFEYTRLDNAIKFVNILYIQAMGEPLSGVDEDIALWSDRRRIPSMSHYFNHINTLHISFAAFGVRNEDPDMDYIRARRYLPASGKRLRGTGLLPDYQQTGLFEKDVPHTITVIKHSDALYMHVVSEGKAQLYSWDLSQQPAINHGRVGLRHMYTRHAAYRNLRISQLE